MIQTNLKVYRYNPQKDQESYYDTYTVDNLPDFATVLDALIKIREEIDGTLTLRCSCRSAEVYTSSASRGARTMQSQAR